MNDSKEDVLLSFGGVDQGIQPMTSQVSLEALDSHDLHESSPFRKNQQNHGSRQRAPSTVACGKSSTSHNDAASECSDTSRVFASTPCFGNGNQQKKKQATTVSQPTTDSPLSKTSQAEKSNDGAKSKKLSPQTGVCEDRESFKTLQTPETASRDRLGVAEDRPRLETFGRRASSQTHGVREVEVEDNTSPPTTAAGDHDGCGDLNGDNLGLEVTSHVSISDVVNITRQEGPGTLNKSLLQTLDIKDVMGKSGITSLINTQRLPTRLIATKWGEIEVTKGGDLRVPFTSIRTPTGSEAGDGNGTSTNLTFVVVCGGLHTRVEGDTGATLCSQSIDEMDESARQWYRYAASVVDTILGFTPRVTLTTTAGQFHLMSTDILTVIGYLSESFFPVQKIVITGQMVSFNTRVADPLTLHIEELKLCISNSGELNLPPSLAVGHNAFKPRDQRADEVSLTKETLKAKMREAHVSYESLYQSWKATVEAVNNCLQLEAEGNQRFSVALRTILGEVHHQHIGDLNSDGAQPGLAAMYRQAYLDVFPLTRSE
eukprot:GHVN01089874.1.p1 GENE.GHVN01089874.1~~GHVN01089874.1.p1  ORF type:complete len:544 (-),score=84.64 GHVN01089874.1:1791-3422(-)